MADYDTHFAFAVPATEWPGKWLEALYETAIQLKEQPEDKGGNVRGHRAASRGTLWLGKQLVHEFEPEGGMRLGVSREPEAIVVWSESGCGNFLFAAEMLQLFLRHLKRDDVLMAQRIRTCSRPLTLRQENSLGITAQL